VVEGFALDAQQRVVAAFQLEAFGDIFVNPGRAALRVWLDGFADFYERSGPVIRPDFALRSSDVFTASAMIDL